MECWNIDIHNLPCSLFCMPRNPRIEYSGTFYHVIVRGNQKQYEVTLLDMRSYSKTQMLLLAKRVFCIVASEVGYKAVEIGRFIDKNPTMVTVSLRESESMAAEAKAVELRIGKIPGFQV